MTSYPPQRGSYSAEGDSDVNWLRAEGREPGTRRRKLAGYLKAANELRKEYQSSYRTGGWADGTQEHDFGSENDVPGSYDEGAYVRRGREEMILFPSYARKHVATKPAPAPRRESAYGGDPRNPQAGDQDYWKREWEQLEDRNAVVDVDVRGWVYSPHSGAMTRKQRLFITLARQLAAIPAPSTTPTGSSPAASGPSSRNTSPHRGFRERMASEQDERVAARQAEKILSKGNAEAQAANQGRYSENPEKDYDNESIHSNHSRSSSAAPYEGRKASTISQFSLDGGNGTSPSGGSPKLEDGPGLRPVQKRASWQQPANMSQAELATANANMMSRLKPFMFNASASTPISAFFYNDEQSRQKTIYTNEYGHFNIRAALDFVPTSVRILANENLSATEPVHITEPKGVSVISDIDDTIKHSAISSGAREIFRNVFIRDLGDLTIDGVKEWYSCLADMGVKFHYVSNSPWQMFPLLKKFFSMAGLPPGSFHLKQYTGMLQGIFEPVAERKKSTLDRLASDFPERSFVLVGDSGEADLEVYTDFVLENPGRVLAVFIRDVTSTKRPGFFDQTMRPPSAPGSPRLGPLSPRLGPRRQKSYFNSHSRQSSDDDPDMRAAIQASLRDQDEKEGKGPALPPRLTSAPVTTEPKSAEPSTGKLIDISEDEMSPTSPLQKHTFGLPPELKKESPSDDGKLSPERERDDLKLPPPALPKKPTNLRSSPSPSRMSEKTVQQTNGKGAPPPRPRRPSTDVRRTSSPVQAQKQTPPPPPKPQTKPQLNRNPPSYTSIAKQKLASAYNALPSMTSQQNFPHHINQPHVPSSLAMTPLEESRTLGGVAGSPPKSRTELPMLEKRAPPLPPPRRALSAYTNIEQQNQRPQARRTGSWRSPFNSPPASPNLRGQQSSWDGNGMDDMVVLNKKEEMWWRRWSRAKQILGSQGVYLKSWRQGQDVAAVCVQLVEQALEEQKKNGHGDSRYPNGQRRR